MLFENGISELYSNVHAVTMADGWLTFSPAKRIRQIYLNAECRFESVFKLYAGRMLAGSGCPESAIEIIKPNFCVW